MQHFREMLSGLMHPSVVQGREVTLPYSHMPAEGRAALSIFTSEPLSSGRALNSHPNTKWNKVKMSVAQFCPTLCDTIVCPWKSLARILEWVVIPFAGGSSWPRDWTWVSHTAGRFFTIWATKEAPREGFNSFPNHLPSSWYYSPDYQQFNNTMA